MYEPHNILVPTDFSKHSDNALEHALHFGSRFRSHITVMHVDEMPVTPMGAMDPESDIIRQFRERQAEFVEEKFARIRRGVEGYPVTLDTKVVQGRAYKAIVEESEREDFDLLVIATRGLTHLAQHLIGSTAERVVRLSRQPVLSIQQAPKPGGVINSVLCPTDLSPAGNAALSYAFSIARVAKAPLYIQYISELEKPVSREQLIDRLPPLTEHYPQLHEVTWEFICDRDVEPSNSIIRFAEDRDVGLIVMSAHGRKGLRRAYIGNNTAEVVRQSTRPVLTVTHPFHKRVFEHPQTEKSQPQFSLPPTTAQ
jgi:nucleotide-binding universal stress UspA family protein